MRSVLSARFQYGLWLIAHLARTLGENAFRFVVFMMILVPHHARAGESAHPALPALLTLALISLLPSVVLAPVWARWARPGGSRSLLIGSTIVGVMGLAFYLLAPDSQRAVFALGLLALSSTLYHTARIVAIPTIARQAEWPSAGVTIGFSLTGAIGTVGGWWIGMNASDVPTLTLGMWSFALLLFGAVSFPVVPRVAGFVPEVFALLRQYDFRVAYAAYLSCGTLVLFLFGLATLIPVERGYTTAEILGIGSFAIGVVLASLQTHPHRGRGWVPFALLALLGFVIYGWSSDDWTHPGIWICCALIMVPLRAALVIEAGEHRAAAAAFLGAKAAGVTLLLVFGLTYFTDLASLRSFLTWGALILTVINLALFTYFFARHLLECVMEVLFLPFYRISGHGPGLHEIPIHGPALIIANHAAWLDPFWMAKILPGTITPMMTARFFDLPVLGWFMRKIVHAIRVPEIPIRRETPEIDEAIAALRRGEIVMIFPEGYLRRKEEQPLRRFGRGVWEMLKAVPNVPIVSCWVEGGWGGYFSYYGGPPTKNKKMDKWRTIRIGVNPVVTIDPKLLDDHMATRVHLMHLVAAARAHIDLPSIDLPPQDDDRTTEKPVAEAEPPHPPIA